MDKKVDFNLSPYDRFSVIEWAKRRADTPLPLSEDDLKKLQGLNEQVSMMEVEQVYLPLSRLLNLYVAATQELHTATREFLGSNGRKTPFIIGIAGSVAAGKSTAARILRDLLSHWPDHPKVDLVTTDGFLHSNSILEKRGLMEKKGFPASYNIKRLLKFLSRIKAGERHVEAPLYSHLKYDLVEGEYEVIDQPDILILEGLNVLQTGTTPVDEEAIPYVSDFFDFSIYIDADEKDVERWYVERFFQLKEKAFIKPESYFHRYASLNDEELKKTALDIWRKTNLVNLHENVLPTRQRADLILEKDENHAIHMVSLRKL